MSTTRIVVTTVVVGVVIGGVAFIASAADVEVDQVVSATDYEGVTVTFSGEVTDSDGNDPTTANFSVVEADDGSATTVDVVDVTAGSDPGVWHVGFDSEATPNDHALAFDELYAATDDEQQDELGLDPVPIPLSADDLNALVTGWHDVALPLADLGEIPAAGEWFANTDTVSVEIEVDGETEVTDVEVSVPRTLNDFVALPVLGDDIDAQPTQREIAEYFENEAPDGVDVNFGDRAANLEFDEDFAHRENRSVELDIDEVPISLDADLDFDFGLRDRLSVAVDEGEARLDQTTDLRVTAAAQATGEEFAARIGFADVTADDVAFHLDADAGLGLTCEAGDGSDDDAPRPDDAPALDRLCDDGEELSIDPAITGNASASVDDIDVVAFEDELSFSDDPLLAVDWDLATDLPDPSDPADADDSDQPGPTVMAGPFEEVGLHHFANADVSAVTLGLEWVASWLDAVSSYDALGEEMPLVDAAPGDVAELAALALERVEELEDQVAAFVDQTDRRPSAQELANELCDLGFAPESVDCDALEDHSDPDELLEIVTEQVDGVDQIQRLAFPVEYDLSLDFADLGELADNGNGDGEEFILTPDLALADAVDRLGTGDVPAFELHASTGEWTDDAQDSGSRLSATVSFELGIDLRDAETLETAWFSGDDAPDDTELFADGIPYRFELGAGDLCNAFVSGLKGEVGDDELNRNRLALENDWGSGDASIAEDCATAFLGAVDWTGDEPFSVPNHDLPPGYPADADVCEVTAGIWLDEDDVEEGEDPTGVFRDLNDIGDGECADAVGVGETLQYLAEAPDPLQMAHRLHLAEGDSDLLALDLLLEGRELEAGVQAGILDLGVTGAGAAGEWDVKVDPELNVSLTDADFDRDPEVADLVELGQRADAGRLGGALDDVAASGEFRGRFDFHNDVVADDPGVGDIGLDVVGDLGGFLTGDADAVTVEEGRLDGEDGRPDVAAFDVGDLDDGQVLVVGIELGDWRSLQDLSADEVVNMLTGVLEQVGEVAGADPLAFEIPIIGTNLQDVTGFSRSAAEVADGIAERDPATLTGLERALRQGLVDSGWPDGVAQTIEVALTGDGDALTFGFDLDHTVQGRYPLSLNLADWIGDDEVAGFPVDVAPVDGGARLSADATAQWNPTLGIAFEGDGLADRAFVEGEPQLSADFNAELDGDVFLGPMTVNAHGEAEADPLVDVTLGDLGDGTRVTLADLELPADPLEVVDIDGTFDADLTVGPTPAGDIAVSGAFDDLVTQGPDTVVVDSTIDFSQITLDLRTLVQGTARTSRFVGRTLQRSDTLAEGLPLIGDELTRIADVGGDVRDFADTVEDLWDEVDGDSDQFLGRLDAELDQLCADLPAGACVATTELLDQNGDPVAADTPVAEAHTLRLEFERSAETTDDLPVTGGLGGDALALTMDGELGYTAGYQAGLAFELSIEDGFVVEATDNDTLFELYAGADASGVDLGADLAGIEIAGVRDGSVVIGAPNGGDGLGPQADAAGFALTLTEPLTLSGLADRDRDPERLLEPELALHADLDLPLHVADGVDAVPTLVAPILFEWTIDETVDDGGVDLGSPRLSIGSEDRPIHADASELVDGILAPVLEEVDDRNPIDFGPVRQSLEREIDLLETSIRDVLEGVPASPDIERARSLFFFLLDIDALATKIDEGSFGGRYNFGYVTVLSPDQDSDALPHLESDLDDRGDFDDVVSAFSNLASLLPTGSGVGSLSHPTADTTSDGILPDMGPVEVPILNEPLSALQLLVGDTESADVSFLHVDVDPQTLGYGFNFEQQLAELNLGFLQGDLTVGLEGQLGLTMRVGFGYDARGITSGHPLNGVYLIDPHDHAGRQQQVVEVGGNVSAFVDGSFGIDVGGVPVASADFRGSGGASATAGVQLFTDSPAVPPPRRDDGRFHLDDINRVREAHTLRATPDQQGVDELLDLFCMFRPGVSLQAHLAFRAEAVALGKTVWSTNWESDWPPLEFTTTCRIDPQAAQLLDGDLVLNAGPDFAEDRFDENPDADNEIFDIGVDEANDQITVDWNGDAAATGLPFATKTYDIDKVQALTVELAANDVGEVVINDFPADIPVHLDGGDAAHSRFEINADVDATIRGADEVVITDGRTDVRTARGGEVTVTGGDNRIVGGPGTAYRFEGDDWGVTDLTHQGDDAVLDFSGSANPVEGTWAFGTVEVTADGGDAGRLDVLDGSTVAKAVGSDEDGDVFEISGDLPEGFVVDAGAGVDNEIVVDADGNTERDVTVRGNADGQETLTVEGSFAGNEVHLRARPEQVDDVDDVDLTPGEDEEQNVDDIAPAEVGFVALTNPLRGDESPIDRVNYDDDVAELVVDGNAGKNQFVLDDVATETTIEGGDGDGAGGGNDFQIGQVFGTAEAPQHRLDDNVVDGGEVRTRNVEGRGPMTLGVSHETTIRGGEGDDVFTAYSSAARLELEGVSGDNTFLLRAFIIEGGVGATGGDGDDYFEYVEDYVQNGEMEIDGGTGGFNTMVTVGTELGDGFVLDDDELFLCRIPREELVDHPGGVAPGEEWASVNAPEPFARDQLPNPEADDACAWEADYTNIDMVVGHGLEGDNIFWTRSVTDGVRFQLFGGEHGSDFYVGELGELASGTPGGNLEDIPSEDLGGDVSGVDGRVLVDGEDVPDLDVSVRDPFVLPGEDDTPTSEPDFDTEFDRENTLLLDARLQGDGETGVMDEGRIWGLDMPDQIDLPAPPDDSTADGGGQVDGGVLYGGMDEMSVLLGDGDDQFTTRSTATFVRELEPEDAEDDTEELEPETETVETATRVDVGGGDDEAVVNTIAGPTTVEAAEGANTVRVGSEASLGQRAPDAASTLGGILDHLDVVGDASAATADVQLDASGSEVAGDGTGDVVDVGQGQVRGLSMPGQVTHTGVGLLDVALTDGADVANVRGTSAAETRLQGLAGDDRVFVADAADVGVDGGWQQRWEQREPGDPRVERDDDAGADTPPHLPGTLADVAGDVDVTAGTGDNLLMVSDRDGADPITGAQVDDDELRGFAGGDIRYDTAGDGTFTGGVTVWTRADDTGGANAAGDEVSVVGTRRDGDPTTLAWTPEHEDEHEGDPRTITTLNTGAGDDVVDIALETETAGFFVAHAGAGDDHVDGASSTLGLVAFGGDGDDAITTGDGDDVVFGDHGRVDYRDDAGELVTRLGDADDASTNDGVARRPEPLSSRDAWNPEPDSLTAVNNHLRVGAGDDVAFGGLGNAHIEADSGRNALLGDHGAIHRVDAPEPVDVATNDGFIDVTARTGPFVYDVDVDDSAGGGADQIRGGTDPDTIFAGPGHDAAAGSPGDGTEDREEADLVFGGHGHDVLWGGPGDDRVYGGTGRDFVNIKQPTFDSDALTDIVHDLTFWGVAWEDVAPEVATDPAPDRANGANLVYNGRGRDAQQADSGGPGRQDGDRLADWYGAFNLYLTCESPYGAGWVLRQPNPDLKDRLVELAEADGARNASDPNSSGWRQLALVTDEHAADNRGSAHPDAPGNGVTCH